jgi:hypothetical protein
MHTRKRIVLTILAVVISFSVATFVYAAYAAPSDVVCMFVKSAGLESLPDGTLVDPDSSASERAFFLKLQSQARARIEDGFGEPLSRPIIAFVRDSRIFWPLKVNDYGSAGSIGDSACVIIGPKGQNVDVVAHELMHQELHDRIGLWRMFAEVPVWFDEGVAMQVDWRQEYQLSTEMSAASDTDVVRRLKSVSQFNQGDNEQITQHYAFAKAEVARWIADIGSRNLYSHFERIRAGEKFDDVVSD